MSFDYSQLEKFDKQLLDIAKNQYPKLCKSQLRQATNKCVKIVRKDFNKQKKHKGKSIYAQTFKASKYAWRVGNDWECRVYNSNPLGNIIQGEHVHTGHKPKKVVTRKIVKGFHNFERTAKDCETEFYKHIREKMVPKIQQAINK